MDRIITLKSVRNFRDFGGYRTRDDRIVKTGHLYRAAHFSDSSQDELQYINGLGLELLVDLRHAPERERQPNKYHPDHQMRLFAVRDREGAAEQVYAPHEMFLKEELERAEDARNYMLRSYMARPHDPVFVEGFSETLKFMAAQSAPLVIHCAAGKDRTGTLAAVIHKTLGVDDEDIMLDYMLTMQAVDIESFLEPAAKFMGKRFGRSFDPNALRPMFGVEPPYLEAALGAMGNFDDYLVNTLGISPAQRSAIVSNYTREANEA